MAKIERNVTVSAARDETTPIAPKEGWSRRDILLLIFVLCIRFAEAIELYLPGVITQQVSCELGVTHLQEGFLGIILYIPFTFSVSLSGYISDRFGRRLVILVTLYISILFTVLCAIVPNYYTLLLSRALIGLCLGVNTSTIAVYFSETVSSREIYRIGISLGSFCAPLGGGWIALFAYILLGSVGWRLFILISSIPFLIFPIIMLQFYLEESVPENSNSSCTEEQGMIPLTVENFHWRVARTAASIFIIMLQGFGAILLLPALIRQNSEDLSLMQMNATLGEQLTSPNYLTYPSEDMRCANTVHGGQLLYIALVTGVANLLGRVTGYLISGKRKFRTTQGLLAIIMTISYGFLVFRSGLVITVVAMGVAKFVYSMIMH